MLMVKKLEVDVGASLGFQANGLPKAELLENPCLYPSITKLIEQQRKMKDEGDKQKAEII
jgi:hypothetical protein